MAFRFDFIPDILISKLEGNEILGIANDWFKSYSTGRIKYTQMSNVMGEVKPGLAPTNQVSRLIKAVFLGVAS